MFEFTTGSIIRCMRRLEETLRQMCQAAKAIGNSELEEKFLKGQCTRTRGYNDSDTNRGSSYQRAYRMCQN